MLNLRELREVLPPILRSLLWVLDEAGPAVSLLAVSAGLLLFVNGIDPGVLAHEVFI